LPLVWDSSVDSRNVHFFVQRIQCGSKITTRSGQIWLLNGNKGPIDGSSLYTWATALCKELPGYDLLIPDHRGIGKSTVLANKCTSKNKLDHFNDCIQFLENESPLGSKDGIKGFGTSQAARDVLYFSKLYKQYQLDKNSGASAQVILYGLNYGSVWLNRVLQLREIVADSVTVDMIVVDSPLGVERSSLSADAIDNRYVASWNELLSNCVSSQKCVNRFQALVSQSTPGRVVNTTDSLQSLLVEIMEKQDTDSACKGTHWKSKNVQLFDVKRLKKLFAAMLYEIPGSKLIFPTLYRLYRCESKDRIWLQNMGYQMSRTIGAVGKVVKPLFFKPSLTISGPEEVLYHVIAASEMTTQPIATNSTYWLNLQKNVPPFVNRNESAITVAKLLNVTTYSDPLVDTWNIFNGPMLIMYGTLGSIATKSFGEEWVNEYGASNHTRVALFPHAMNIMAQSTVMAKSGDSTIAGQKTMVDFIVSGGTNSVNETLISLWKHNTYNFDSSAKSATYVGYSTDKTLNLWDDGPSKTIEKKNQLHVAKNLGAGCGVLVFMCAIFAFCMVLDGTLCKWYNNRQSKQYLLMNH